MTYMLALRDVVLVVFGQLVPTSDKRGVPCSAGVFESDIVAGEKTHCKKYYDASP